ncbi:tRNA-dihydrouridine(47) synthase [NAD(P)(+)]-like [Herrania umbratica]|uniref:tRNA-dihydrouridine(47) synthase [NAD(P)(+)] n=1 Tax=Herrania umbratica TaxID=108875 RepID=A0A6J1AFH3_9ROSI|nr:tRNA-dihydrouridine(47) synthase [NAD(P)(+)]-like [Herrania umbratica]
MAESSIDISMLTNSEMEGVPSSQPPANSNGTTQQTPEELVARAIAPIKREFLRPPPPSRTTQNDAASDADSNANAKQSQSSLVKEKKSKRQLKRERRQEQKSALNLCPEIAKTGDVNACPYKDKCRFSHDIQAFLAEKPADLEGECPFVRADAPCPYGLACRFAGTHKDGASAASANVLKKSSEVNGLSKDVQKLLWKNKMRFTKADAVIKSLGLTGPNWKIKKLVDKEEDKVVSNGSHAVGETECKLVANDSVDCLECPPTFSPADNVEEACATDELRPSKKAKSVVDEKCCSDEVENGATVLEKDVEKNSTETESVHTADDVLAEPDRSLKIHPREKKLIDFRERLYLAPLTTVGNLPFRRVCKTLGADVTCGEMAMCTNLLQGQASEWALLRRHSSEDLFGVQICGAHPDTVARTVELIDKECTVDFIDINMGCPIDIVVNKGAGSSLLTKPLRMKGIIEAASGTVDKPITVKVRTGYFEGKNRVDSLIADIGIWGATAVTIHGRSRQQRYSKLADWDYIYQCVRKAPSMLQVLGNGDIFSYLDWKNHRSNCPELSTCMIARGALIKPWLFTEIKEQRHWDISSGERLNILKDYVRFGLEHWGSDRKGVETTRHFLLEWLGYTCRYIPVGLLDVIPQRLNWRPPSYYGRDDLETLMASDSAADWVRISEMLLGKVPDGFTFAPKHKSNAYDRAENG